MTGSYEIYNNYNLAREIIGNIIPIPGNKVFDYVTYEPYGAAGSRARFAAPLQGSICMKIFMMIF
jgi:hypothetical protein